ncbi:fimbrial protein [Photobacterium piscicola]|uniref:Fimbrial protein n=1 Tax=Photobacterium piscicola TaxID=1378299 RepID=A0ABU6LK94_9GAMM|nr:fimbrial protein [Photobacterium piscicola]MEC6899972.1 fimbrial protein [Photobacterium piscicola]
MNKVIGITVIGLSIFSMNYAIAGLSTGIESTTPSSGKINFTGVVVQATCSINLVSSTQINLNNTVNLGVMKTTQKETPPVYFYLKPDPKCAPTFKQLTAVIAWSGSNFNDNGLTNLGTSKNVDIALTGYTANSKISPVHLTQTNKVIKDSYTALEGDKKTFPGYLFSANLQDKNNQKPIPGSVLSNAIYNVTYN